MGECPKCKAEIDHLVKSYCETNECTEDVNLVEDEDGNEEDNYLDSDNWEQRSTIDTFDVEYVCPSCCHTLFGDVDEDVLIKFLMKKDNSVW